MGVDLDKLTAPFPKSAIKQRSGGNNRMLDYVEGHTVIHRLNDATGNCWDMSVREITSKQIGDNTLMMAHVALTIPGLGTREGLGVQMVHARGGEDLVKGCITDALKKAATLFGVGLELYGPDYENGETAPQRQNTLPAERRQSSPPPQQQPRREAVSQPQGQSLPTPGPGLVTEPQIRMLFRLGKALGWTEADFHRELFETYGHASTKDLTKQEASEWIGILKIAAREDDSAPPQAPPLAEPDGLWHAPVDGEPGFDQHTR